MSVSMTEILNLIQNASPVIAAVVIAMLFRLKAVEKDIKRNKQQIRRI